jgi:hypothetical protein
LISVTYFHPKIAKEGERKYQQRMQLVLKWIFPWLLFQ